MPPGETSLVYRQRYPTLRRAGLKSFATELASRVLKRDFVTLITGDQELAELNRRFRGQRGPTDVLSFPPAEGSAAPGELAISYDRAREQARQHGHRVEQEVRILMLHGVLHLAGYDHEADQGEMGRVEARLRRRFGLPEGLIARSAAS